MSARSDAAITTAGVALGAALIGIPVGVLIARHLRTDQPAKPYSQAATITATITKLTSRRSKP